MAPGASRRRAAALACAGLAVCAAPPARAQASEMFSPEAFHGLAELRLAAADGERGWLDGGLGKGAIGGEGGADLALSQAVVEWRPRFNFLFSAVASAQWQRDAAPRFDLDEAWLAFKSPPMEWGRFSARAGIFYPPISLEHEGTGWTTPDTLSASAINTWVGEEVKVGALEATYRRRLGEHELAATAAMFGWNDTAGTLLTFRGWALHGVRTGKRTEFELPPLSPFMARRQADETYPMWELDHRAGYYGRLEWRPPAPLTLEALYYDNRGDRVAVKERQWSWNTRFLDLGVRWEPTPGVKVLAQAMSGRTRMGYATPETWADVRFRAAYVLASKRWSADTLTGRLDAFDVRDRTWRLADDNDERGWAATAAWRRRLTPHLDLIVEGQRIWSDRPSRALAGEGARQTQNLLASALRLGF